MTRWDFDARHPEATLGTLFLPVWYEGRQQPEHAWQSTGASDASEAKLGLMPLVFGTLKATFYTMLFGAPLALLAAIYSSEFLHPRTKARVKPMIEMMASLPSVVLGFFAGLVMAPFVEGIVPQVLTCVFTVPLSFLLRRVSLAATAERGCRAAFAVSLAVYIRHVAAGNSTGHDVGPARSSGGCSQAISRNGSIVKGKRHGRMVAIVVAAYRAIHRVCVWPTG